jgi:hypothetical protein
LPAIGGHAVARTWWPNRDRGRRGSPPCETGATRMAKILIRGYPGLLMAIKYLNQRDRCLVLYAMKGSLAVARKMAVHGLCGWPWPLWQCSGLVGEGGVLRFVVWTISAALRPFDGARRDLPYQFSTPPRFLRPKETKGDHMGDRPGRQIFQPPTRAWHSDCPEFR